MFGECHAHIIMDGNEYRPAVALHERGIDESVIHRHFKGYQEHGINFVRECGDALGVSLRAKTLAPQYGIDYRTPCFAIHKVGHYGGIVGRGFSTMKEYALLVEEAMDSGADFIKIMTTGILDFSNFGKIVAGSALEANEVKEMVHIAHEHGFAVASHTNGAQAIIDAVEAGVDSIEHGNYLDASCIQALAESKTALVPTAAVAVSQKGTGRHRDEELLKIIEASAQAIAEAFEAGVVLALGSDAGAPGVKHGEGLLNEYAFFLQCFDNQELLDARLREGELFIKNTFKRPEHSL